MRLLSAMACALAAAACTAPFSAESGAERILVPARRPAVPTDVRHADIEFRSADGLVLRGWLFRTQAAERRGLLVYLHGIGDDRRGAVGLARRFGPVSTSWATTARARRFGRPLPARTATTRIASPGGARPRCRPGVPVLFGCRLGAWWRSKTAALEPRVRGVIAQSPFSDRRTIVRDRAPGFAGRDRGLLALALAGERGGFPPAEVSAAAAAAGIQVPVLLIHGAADNATRPDPRAHPRRLHGLGPWSSRARATSTARRRGSVEPHRSLAGAPAPDCAAVLASEVR